MFPGKVKVALREELAVEELQNFEDIARFLNPSPGAIPQLKGVDIDGLSLPLRRGIGGDHILYIDFEQRFDLDERIEDALRAGREKVARKLRRNRNRAGILVADASGHRMTDALIAAMLHQAFLLGTYYELEMFGEITTKIFEHINERFYRTSSINKFFTMIYGEISTRGKFRFLSAGHPPPAVFSREYGRFMPIDENRRMSSIPVGMLPSCGDPDERRHPSLHGRKKLYAVNEIDLLARGDILLLYTDGLSDHGDGRYFPEELQRLLAADKDRTATEICERIGESLPAYAPQQDDVSVVVVKYMP
jgi:serine phosphatase RsbU (regulator of sigma subunit)